MPSGADPRRAAIDFALGVGRRTMSNLRRFKHELADAQQAGLADRFWPFALLSAFSRVRRRRRIKILTPLVQEDLAALDAAVAVLRSHGLELSARAAAQAQKVRTSGSLQDALFAPGDPWDGPMHVVQGAMQRVDVILEELRRLRD
jgi:hypothetical protein